MTRDQQIRAAAVLAAAAFCAPSENCTSDDVMRYAEIFARCIKGGAS